MDQQQLQQKIAEYFSKLPPNAQEYFAKMDWMNTLQTIAGKYQLNEQQVASLGTETTLLLLGIVHPDEYTSFLKKDMAMEDGTSIQMFNEIDTQIVGGLRGDLADTHMKNSIELADKEYGGSMKLDERLASLPDEVKDAIVNSDYQAKLYAIAGKYKLSIEQMGMLENITNKVMLGVLHPDEYAKSVADKLGMPNDKVNELVGEVNEGVFKNIREGLKSYMEVNSSTPEAPVPPYAPYAPASSMPEVAKVELPAPMTKSTIPEAPIPAYKPAPDAIANVAIPVVAPEAKIVVETALNKTTPKDDSNILSGAGIEMVQDMNSNNTMGSQPKVSPLVERGFNTADRFMESGIDVIPDRVADKVYSTNSATGAETLSGINNPTAGVSSMLADKLGKTTINPTPIINQSLTKDPYKEVIE